MNNTPSRDAKRIIHGIAYALKHIPANALPHVAKGFAANFNIPQKVMLKAMSRYTRLHHSN
jgi:hypothetical protein